MANDFWDAYKDPRWQKKRLEIMKRDGFKCKQCESESKTLNVHHAYYEKDRKPWEYDNHLLVTMCDDCHENVHASFNLIRGLITIMQIKGDVDSLGEVVGFVKGCFIGLYPGASIKLEDFREVNGVAFRHRISAFDLAGVLREHNDEVSVNAISVLEKLIRRTQQ